MTSPSGFNCVTAPAKVWQGVAMLSQELALLPERAETKTRLARARAGEAEARERTQTQRGIRPRLSRRGLFSEQRVDVARSNPVIGRASGCGEQNGDERCCAVMGDLLPARHDGSARLPESSGTSGVLLALF